jgi:hypothetical protein
LGSPPLLPQVSSNFPMIVVTDLDLNPKCKNL